MKVYIETLSKCMHPSSIEYWRRFGNVLSTNINADDAGDTGRLEAEVNSYRNSLFILTGRKMVRTEIQLDKVDDQDCSKNYFKGNSAIPSFITVKCCCENPKLLRFVILKKFESILAALSSVLTHFPLTPRRVSYDNACNTYDSSVTRIPWFLRWIMLMVDRFHYTGHT